MCKSTRNFIVIQKFDTVCCSGFFLNTLWNIDRLARGVRFHYVEMKFNDVVELHQKTNMAAYLSFEI